MSEKLMEIKLGTYEKSEIKRVAKEFNISASGLELAYKMVMKCNFDQDIRDIANENENELRETYGEYGQEKNYE